MVPGPVAARTDATASALAGMIADAVREGKGRKSELAAFYAARQYRPLWIADGAPRPAAHALLELARSAQIDRINVADVRARDLEKALAKARSGNQKDVLRLEVEASRTFAAYVQQMRRAARAAMITESPALEPGIPKARFVLETAAGATDLDAYVADMGWMHPLYAGLRRPLMGYELGREAREQLMRNLDRVRAIPANPAPRYVLVDTAGATLWMYEDGKPAGSMRVVVGKPEVATQTPMMAGFLRFAQVNPYWNIPPDLVRERIAGNVLKRGPRYLRASGYQVLSDWTDKARVIDPAKVDWRKVAEGRVDVRVRQLPGGGNAMGKVKFMFPNAQGIYLHDTPEKHLMQLGARQLSSGCVRLEDAARFGRWLMKKPLPATGRRAEQRVDLPEPVPIYITYLTAMPGAEGKIALLPDVYGRDGERQLATTAALPNSR